MRIVTKVGLDPAHTDGELGFAWIELIGNDGQHSCCGSAWRHSS